MALFGFIDRWIGGRQERVAARAAREAAALETRVTGALAQMGFDAKAPDAARLKVVEGLSDVLWPAAWEALEHIAKNDPSAAVRAAAARRSQRPTMRTSGGSIADTYRNPLHPNSALGPGPSFYKR